MDVLIGKVEVAGWGSTRHAREVRGRKQIAYARREIQSGNTAFAYTEKGVRKLVAVGKRNMIVTRIP